MPSKPKNTICLWFDKDAEDAAASTLRRFRRVSDAVTKRPAITRRKKGDVLTWSSRASTPCLGLNGARVQA